MLFAPVLALALTAPEAQAMDTIVKVGRRKTSVARTVVVTTDGDGSVADVVADVSSELGKERVNLVEVDSRLHGSAAIKALPASSANLTLTLYDASSAARMSFFGTLSADGSVVLYSKDAPACDAKQGCSAKEGLDIEVLAADVYPGASGYELTFTLNGADAYDVAYADVTVLESDEYTTCDKVTGECTTTGSSWEYSAEVGWDEIVAVWEGDLTLEAVGLVEVRAAAWNADGEKVDSVRAKLGLPCGISGWGSGGSAGTALAVDEDPFTTVALISDQVHADGTVMFKGQEGGTTYCEKGKYFGDDCSMVVVTSDGWSFGDALPVDAQVEVAGGETLAIPVNSYQVVAAEAFFPMWAEGSEVEVRVNGALAKPLIAVPRTTVYQLSVNNGGSSVVLHQEEDGQLNVSVAAWSERSTDLPTGTKITVTPIEKGVANPKLAETFELSFDDEVLAVFANQVEFAADPIGEDFGGKVQLQSAVDKKGKQETLVKGGFSGAFMVDDEGGVALAGAKGAEKGDILIGGEPIDVEFAGAPPVIAYATKNGSGQPYRTYLSLARNASPE